MGLPAQPNGIPLKACRIVAPETPAIQERIGDLTRLLRQRGATVSLMAPLEALDESRLRLCVPSIEIQEHPETLILVGNIIDNQALLPLYTMFLDFTDAYHPGGDGYIVRTVLDAPFRGIDTLVLGGSSDPGILRAIRRACEIVAGLKQDRSFPLTLEVDLDSEALKNLHSIPVPQDPMASAYLYGLTGTKGFATACKGWFLGPRQAPDRAPDSYEVSDYELEPLLRSWALINDSGVFTPSELQTVHQLLLNTLLRNEAQYWRARDGGSIGSRHQTMGTSAFLSVVRFLLRRGNPNAEAKSLLHRWKNECEAYFANAMTTFHDDFEGIPGYHSVQPIANYALETGAASYFRRPKGMSPFELAILRAYASVDNLGYYCGTGTYEEARPGTVKAGIMLGYPLAIAASVNRDGRAQWLLRHFRGTDIGTWGLLSAYGAHAFTIGSAVPEIEPQDFLGIVRVPLGEYRYSRLPHRDQPGRMSLPVPYERTFEKLCFRDTFKPEGQYLILQGCQAVGGDNAAPLDANSIIRYTDKGVAWLIANTDRQGNFYRNAVFVSDGETDAPGWAGCELIGQDSSGDAYIVVSRLGSYHGSVWTRHLLWLRGKAFALLDTVRFDSPGKRQVFCTFRTAPPASLHGREWIARSADAEFHLLNADDVAITSRRDGPEGAAIPTVLREARALTASPGTVATFRNLFYVSTPQHPQQFQVKPFGKTALLLLDTGRKQRFPGMFAVRGEGNRLKTGPFESDAAALYIGPEGISLVGGTAITFNGKRLPVGHKSSLPFNIGRVLAEIWHKTHQAGASKGSDRESTLPVKWRFSGMEIRRPALLAATVSASEPPVSGSLDDLVDGFIPLWTGDAYWTNPHGLTLTFDLHRPEDISGIEFATGLVSSINVLPPESSLKDRMATVQLSNDGFGRDTRSQQAIFRAGFTIEPLHKGSVCAMGRWRLMGLKGKARYVRLVFPPGPIALREVFIRRNRGTELRFGPSLASDLDGDGREEAILTTDTGEMAVIGEEGSRRWGYRFAGPVTCLAAGALEPGHPQKLLVGTWEARLYCFSPQGHLEWVTDFTSLGGDLPVPFSIGLTGPKADGRRSIIVGNYARVSFVSPDGHLLSHSFAHGAFETMVLTDGMDLTGDGVGETLLYNVWGSLSLVDHAKRAVVGYIECPRGEGLLFRKRADAPGSGPAVLVASDNGIGLLRLASGRYDWQKSLNPLSCAATADIDGEEEILLGRRDGWLLLLSADGQVKNKAMIGDEVRAIIFWKKRQIWATTGKELLLMDGSLKLLERFSIQTQRMVKVGENILLLGEDGVVRAFQPAY